MSRTVKDVSLTQIAKAFQYLLDIGYKNPTTGCFEIHQGLGKTGYSKITINFPRKTGAVSILGHRAAMMLKLGKVDLGELCVLHRCDNPRCINTNHLFLGTNMDNVQDKLAKGRGVTNEGSTNPNHKLTEEEVEEIYESYQSTLELAILYQVSVNTILSIRTEKTWVKFTEKLVRPPTEDITDGRSGLTRDQIVSIFLSDEATSTLAKYYQIHRESVNSIRRGVTFSKLTRKVTKLIKG